MNNKDVTGLKDFKHARGPRNSAYPVNLTYDRHTYMGERAKRARHSQICTIENREYTRKMVPIKGRATASFSSMLKL